MRRRRSNEEIRRQILEFCLFLPRTQYDLQKKLRFGYETAREARLRLLNAGLLELSQGGCVLTSEKGKFYL